MQYNVTKVKWIAERFSYPKKDVIVAEKKYFDEGDTLKLKERVFNVTEILTAEPLNVACMTYYVRNGDQNWVDLALEIHERGMTIGGKSNGGGYAWVHKISEVCQ